MAKEEGGGLWGAHAHVTKCPTPHQTSTCAVCVDLAKLTPVPFPDGANSWPQGWRGRRCENGADVTTPCTAVTAPCPRSRPGGPERGEIGCARGDIAYCGEIFLKDSEIQESQLWAYGGSTGRARDGELRERRAGVRNFLLRFLISVRFLKPPFPHPLFNVSCPPLLAPARANCLPTIGAFERSRRESYSIGLRSLHHCIKRQP